MHIKKNVSLMQYGCWNSGYIAFTVLFFVIRLFLYPLNFQIQNQSSWQQLHNLSMAFSWKALLTRYADGASFITDVTSLSFISSGNMILKGSAALLLISFAFYFFIKSSYKHVIIFIMTGGLLFLWPAILRYYTLRYLYFFLPFLMIVLALLALEIKKKVYAKQITLLFFLCAIGNNTYFVEKKLYERQVELHFKTVACKKFAQEISKETKPLLFIGIPRTVFYTGLAQRFWFMDECKNLSIYFDDRLFPVMSNVNSMVGDIIKIKKDGNLLTISSLDTNKVWWNCQGTKGLEMGEIIENKLDNSGKIKEISYRLFNEYNNYNFVLVTWDYQKNTFKVLS